MKRPMKTIDEMFDGLKPGMGAMTYVGSDTYGRYVSFVDKENRMIGTYDPQFTYKTSWEEGSMTPEPFDPEHKTDTTWVAWRGRWWKLDDSGMRTQMHEDLRFNSSCYQYLDPSF